MLHTLLVFFDLHHTAFPHEVYGDCYAGDCYDDDYVVFGDDDDDGVMEDHDDDENDWR